LLAARRKTGRPPRPALSRSTTLYKLASYGRDAMKEN
jgi:hypothetical protein